MNLVHHLAAHGRREWNSLVEMFVGSIPTALMFVVRRVVHTVRVLLILGHSTKSVIVLTSVCVCKLFSQASRHARPYEALSAVCENSKTFVWLFSRLFFK